MAASRSFWRLTCVAFEVIEAACFLLPAAGYTLTAGAEKDGWFGRDESMRLHTTWNPPAGFNDVTA
jgi:hypothetical protein